MKKEKLKVLLVRMLRLYTLQVTLITVLMIILGKLLDPDRIFSYEAFLSPLIYALIGTGVALVTCADKELSVRQLIVRKVIALLLTEAALLFIALRSDTIPTDRPWVLPGIALGILAVFLLTNAILYLQEKREAERLSADLAHYQEKHVDSDP